MKKVVSLVLSFALILSFMSVASASSDVQTVLPDPSKIEGMVTTQLTEGEYVKLVSKQNGISEEKVKEKLKEYKKSCEEKYSSTSTDSKEIAPESIATNGLSYFQSVQTKDFASGSRVSMAVEVGMAYTVYSYSSFRQINSIDSYWTGAAGSGAYTWLEYTKYTYPSTFPTIQAEAHARGAVEVAIDVSVTGQASIKSELLAIGFSVSVQYGTTYYLRKIDNIDLVVRVMA